MNVYKLLPGREYLRNVHCVWQEHVAHLFQLLIAKRVLCADRQVPLAIVNEDYNLHALVNIHARFIDSVLVFNTCVPNSNGKAFRNWLLEFLKFLLCHNCTIL